MPETETTAGQTASPGHHRAPAHEMRVVPSRHAGSWLAAAVLLLLASMLAHTLVTNANLDWPLVGHYFTSSQILRGLSVTIELTVIAMAVSVILGTAIAIMRLSANPVILTASWLYVWVFRSVPPLVQIIFWYNLSYLFTHLSIGIPYGPSFASTPVNQLITPFMAAILGLTLNESAYMAEIIRGGIIAVDPGQLEAGLSIGMTRIRALYRIILPQAMRAILPATGNETINMMKTTSLVSVVALADLLYSAEQIYSQNYQTIPLLVVASLWYLVISSLLSVGQYYLERHFGRSARGPARRSPWLARALSRGRRQPCPAR